jgi:hypothetical protein
MVNTTALSLTVCALLAFAPGLSAQNKLSVDVQAAQGFAAPGNNQAANFLVIVTNPFTGAGVTTLTQTDFAINNHFGIPGQVCGFSNGIVLFHNVGTGAYQIQVKLHHVNPNVACAWVKGDYLAQVLVSSPQGAAQVPVKLSIQ